MLRESYGKLLIAAFVAGCIGISFEIILAWRFYQNTSTLTPGTAIRPMGQSFSSAVVALMTFLTGSIPALLATIECLDKRQWRRTGIGVLIFLWCLIPFPLFRYAIIYVMHDRGLVPSP